MKKVFIPSPRYNNSKFLLHKHQETGESSEDVAAVNGGKSVNAKEAAAPGTPTTFYNKRTKKSQVAIPQSE